MNEEEANRYNRRYGDDHVPKITVSLSRTVKLQDYESMKVDVYLSQIPFDASEELIEEMMGKSRFAVSKLSSELREKIAKIRMEDREDAREWQELLNGDRS